jgi:pyruvate dehydrogenase E1 component beta subunit
MRAAIEAEGPVVFLEHKLLSAMWLEWMGGSRRSTVAFDIPPDGTHGVVETPPPLVPIGQACVARDGADLAIVSVAVGVHRSLAAASVLHAAHGVEATVVDLRTVTPLDATTVTRVAAETGRVLVVDEDFSAFGLSGEIAAVLATSEPSCRFDRVATGVTIPYARRLEGAVLPSVERIVERSLALCR